MYEFPGSSGGMEYPPQLHVDIKYAATSHAFWPRELDGHFHVRLQSGAEMSATAMPERSNKGASTASLDICDSLSVRQLGQGEASYGTL